MPIPWRVGNFTLHRVLLFAPELEGFIAGCLCVFEELWLHELAMFILRDQEPSHSSAVVGIELLHLERARVELLRLQERQLAPLDLATTSEGGHESRSATSHVW